MKVKINLKYKRKEKAFTQGNKRTNGGGQLAIQNRIADQLAVAVDQEQSSFDLRVRTTYKKNPATTSSLTGQTKEKCLASDEVAVAGVFLRVHDFCLFIMKSGRNKTTNTTLAYGRPKKISVQKTPEIASLS